MPNAAPLTVPVPEATEYLAAVLQRVEDFASQQALGTWSQIFASAAERLDGLDDSALGHFRDQ